MEWGAAFVRKGFLPFLCLKAVIVFVCLFKGYSKVLSKLFLWKAIFAFVFYVSSLQLVGAEDPSINLKLY